MDLSGCALNKWLEGMKSVRIANSRRGPISSLAIATVGFVRLPPLERARRVISANDRDQIPCDTSINEDRDRLVRSLSIQTERSGSSNDLNLLLLKILGELFHSFAGGMYVRFQMMQVKADPDKFPGLHLMRQQLHILIHSANTTVGEADKRFCLL